MNSRIPCLICLIAVFVCVQESNAQRAGKHPPSRKSSVHRIPYNPINPAKIHKQSVGGIGASIRSSSGRGNSGIRYHAPRFGNSAIAFHFAPNIYDYPYFGNPGRFQSYYQTPLGYQSLDVISSTYIHPSPMDFYGPGANYSTPNTPNHRSHSALDYLDILNEQMAMERRDANRNVTNRVGSHTGNLISTQFDAVSFQRQAEAAFQRAQFSEARKNVQHALVEDPENGKLHLFNSHISLAMGDFTTAFQHLETATGLLHRNEWDFLIRNQSQIYLTSRYDNDLQKLSEHISRNPNDTNALTLRGFHLGCIGKVEMARMDLSQVLVHDDQHDLAIHLLAALRPNSLHPEQQPIILAPTSTLPAIESLPEPIHGEMIEGELLEPQIEGPSK